MTAYTTCSTDWSQPDTPVSESMPIAAIGPWGEAAMPTEILALHKLGQKPIRLAAFTAQAIAVLFGQPLPEKSTETKRLSKGELPAPGLPRDTYSTERHSKSRRANSLVSALGNSSYSRCTTSLHVARKVGQASVTCRSMPANS